MFESSESILLHHINIMSFFESTFELIIVQKEKKTRVDANVFIEIEKTTFHSIETKKNHSNVWVWLYTFYYIYLSIISIASRLYDVLKIVKYSEFRFAKSANRISIKSNILHDRMQSKHRIKKNAICISLYHNKQ